MLASLIELEAMDHASLENCLVLFQLPYSLFEQHRSQIRLLWQQQDVKESSFMPTISKENNCVTLINIFTVEPSNQKKLMELLVEATERSVRHVQGFISASFHRSLDGTRVAAYAQWRSAADYQAMRKNAVALPYMEQALALATFDSGMYEVAETFDGVKTP
jgi:hypothetical protein